MWSSEAPSNIALIKYMGKMQNSRTLVEPYNISLSYTLHRFFTKVSLENCLSGDQFISEINFNKKAVDRFLLHVNHIKNFFNYKGFFLVRSSNNFPHSAGIASSSSSFAALTKCVVTALCDISCVPLLSPEQMSKISRMSSGSSCRSFFSPWSVWDSSGASALSLKINNLNHDLILIDQTPKKVSSSEAHNLVKSSPLFEGRLGRARQRFESLRDALNNDQWSDARLICREEFLDMHQLFETSTPSFRYIQPKTDAVLDEIQQFCEINNDGPIVTVDAGPNIHLLWKKDQDEIREELRKIITLRMSCEII